MSTFFLFNESILKYIQLMLTKINTSKLKDVQDNRIEVSAINRETTSL